MCQCQSTAVAQKNMETKVRGVLDASNNSMLKENLSRFFFC